MNERLGERLRVILPAVARLAVLAGIALVLGLAFGSRAGLWFLVLSFGVLLAAHLYYLTILGAWLEKPSLGSIPDGFGAWAEVFTRLYKARRVSEQSERRLIDNEERFRRTISALPEGDRAGRRRVADRVVQSGRGTPSRHLDCVRTRACA